jgi:2-iminobutanoate/2-iminopropanoate deaminase
MAKKEVVLTDQAFASGCPLSQALRIEATQWLFCSGQLGLDPQTGELCAGIEAQTAQTLQNLEVLREAGGPSR